VTIVDHGGVVAVYGGRGPVGLDGAAEPGDEVVALDGNVAGLRGLHESLEKAGIRHVYWECPGTAHEWLSGRRDLRGFAPRLFQK